MDKPGHETDRAFYLESWNGDGSFVYDRIGRGTIRIEAACVSILGGIQPGPLAHYLRAAARGDQDDGLVSRLQLLVYPDVAREWRNVDRWPDSKAKDRAFEVYRRLDALEPAAIGAELDEDGASYLRFAPDAQDRFDAWRRDLEVATLRSGNDHPLVESHLAKYRSLMPALALIFHLVDVVDGSRPGPVSLRATELAVAWCDLLEQHARRVYHAAGEGDVEPARRLAERVRRGDLANPFTVRQVVQHGWSGLSTTEEVSRAVNRLERDRWVLGVERASTSGGGRPTMDYWVNPLALEASGA